LAQGIIAAHKKELKGEEAEEESSKIQGSRFKTPEAQAVRRFCSGQSWNH
jgi:hypothetical protein